MAAMMMAAGESKSLARALRRLAGGAVAAVLLRLSSAPPSGVGLAGSDSLLTCNTSQNFQRFGEPISSLRLRDCTISFFLIMSRVLHIQEHKVY